MSVLTELTVPAEEFVLAETLSASPGMRIEVKRVVAHQSDVTPYFWAADGDFETFERALEDDESVRDAHLLQENEADAQPGQDEDERFYRARWGMDVPNVVTAASNAGATVLEAVSEDEREWLVRLLFPDEGSLSTFSEYCAEHGISFSPDRVYRPENPQKSGQYEITPEQQEALEAAYHAGYFKVPRDRTLTAIAGDLDISRNALSARIRRGLDNLLSNTLVHEE